MALKVLKCDICDLLFSGSDYNSLPRSRKAFDGSIKTSSSSAATAKTGLSNLCYESGMMTRFRTKSVREFKEKVSSVQAKISEFLDK